MRANVFSLDSFFYLGGFLVSYAILDKKKLNFFSITKPLNVILVVLHRALRIWPCYILAILFWWKVSPFLISGPL
jgi:peptidoglycan/LPS O-acetylase OafA/YrhL